MQVQFIRTGERRYAVKVFRENHPTLEMDPAPGYDSTMPHDLAHFIVESELNLHSGIYGQLADGGTAGTFRPLVTENSNSRELSRLRKRVTRRGEKLLRNGRDDSAISEEAVYLCFVEWRKREVGLPERKMLQNQLQYPPPQLSGKVKITPPILNRICHQLGKLSHQWSKLAPGESLTVVWTRK